MSSPDQALSAIFSADRSLREHEELLLRAAPASLTRVLTAAVDEAKSLSDTSEATLRLQRLSDLCAQVPGPEMTDALIAILDSDIPSVRVHAAEALVDVGFERYAEMARGVERALERKGLGPALRELPWVLCEIAEPSAAKLIARFLHVTDIETVASAVEALAELGDPQAVKDLLPLRNDSRPVELEDDDETLDATLGDLVAETIASLEGKE